MKQRSIALGGVRKRTLKAGLKKVYVKNAKIYFSLSYVVIDP